MIAAAVHGLISSSTPLAMSSARNLMAMSETPKSAPAAPPSIRPCAADGTRRWVEAAAIAMLKTRTPHSIAISAATAYSGVSLAVRSRTSGR